MITLKIKPYNEKEAHMLKRVLSQSIVFVKDLYCYRACEDCPVRHLCIDLQSAELYAEDVLNEIKSKQ